MFAAWGSESVPHTRSPCAACQPQPPPPSVGVIDVWTAWFGNGLCLTCLVLNTLEDFY
jgi:hypothetical protein